MTRATDEDGGGVMPEPTLSDDELVIASIAEVLREPGARLSGDSRLFMATVAPLYQRYGHALVDAALRQIHVDAKRRAASEIRALRMNAARLKREDKRLERQGLKRLKLPPLCEDCGINWSDPPSRLCPGCEAYQEHQP